MNGSRWVYPGLCLMLALGACKSKGENPSPGDQDKSSAASSTTAGLAAERGEKSQTVSLKELRGAVADGRRRPKLDARLHQADKNNDGELDQAELNAMLETWADEIMKRDRNADGRLTLVEFAGKDPGAAIEQHFGRMDQNGDKSVTRDELIETRMKQLTQRP